jgi:hypothetical protein
MRRLSLFCLLATGSLSAQVNLSRSGDTVHIEIAGKPFSDFFFGPDAPKPYLHPLRSASGKIVTRRFPMEKVEGETTTDQHQRSVWLGYSSVNGFDFWKNEFSYNDPLAGKVVTVRVDHLKSGAHEGSLQGVFRWLSPAGEPILEETRNMTFREGSELRMIDVDITLKALIDTKFGDSKDGAFSVRLAEPLIEKNGGVITNSAGGRGMKETWGQQANWVDYSGELQGEKLGVALFEHPTSFHHPARWHVRDYGLLAANPFGSKAFNPNLPDATFTLPKGQSIHLKYRIVVHPQMTPQQIEALYKNFAK